MNRPTTLYDQTTCGGAGSFSGGWGITAYMGRCWTPPLRKKHWIDNAHEYATLELGDRMAFYSYWNSVDGYDYRLTTPPGTIQAVADWATDPRWQS